MLLSSAEYLNPRCDFRSLSDRGHSEHAVASDVNAARNPSLPVREKRPELYAAFGRTLQQCKPVIGHSQIISRQARRLGTGLRPEGKQRLDASKAGQKCRRKSKRQKQRVHTILEKRPQIAFYPQDLIRVSFFVIGLTAG